MKKFKATALALIIALTFGTVVFAADTKAKLININTATEAQLKTIPGVGDEYAKKIIAGRPYTAKAQLKTKEIIPADVYSQIKTLLASVC
jgi:competence protein ComEA